MPLIKRTSLSTNGNGHHHPSRRSYCSRRCLLMSVAPLLVIYTLFILLDSAHRDIQHYYSPSSSSSSLFNIPTNKTDTAAADQKAPASAPAPRTSEKHDWLQERIKMRQEAREERRKSRNRLRKPPSSNPWSTIRDKDNGLFGSILSRPGTASTTNENDMSTFDYRQPAIPTEYTLPDPQIFNSTTHQHNILMVLSARQNFDLRSQIRNTWGKDHAVYFVIGGPAVNVTNSSANETSNEPPAEVEPNTPIDPDDPEQEQNLLELEQIEHRDLIDCIHPDSYQSLPYKLRFAYQWIVNHYDGSDVHWITKVDDDTVVRVDTLNDVILRPLDGAHHPIVVGRIIEHSKVARTGKWAEVRYEPEYYPYWPQGSCGHVVSRKVAEYVALGMNDTSPDFIYYQGEDVSLGIWLDEAKIQTTTLPEESAASSASSQYQLRQPVLWYNSQYFQNHGRCEEPEWIVIGHQITVEQMEQCYEAADEWTAEQRHAKPANFWHMETVKQRGDSSW